MSPRLGNPACPPCACVLPCHAGQTNRIQLRICETVSACRRVWITGMHCLRFRCPPSASSGKLQRMHALITGGAGGIAQALFAVLQADGWTANAPPSAELDVTDPSSVARYFDGRSDDLVV